MSSFYFQTWATAISLEWDQGREGKRRKKKQTTANRPHFLRPVWSNSLKLKALPVKRPQKLEREERTELEKQTEITLFYTACNKAIVHGTVLFTWHLLRLWLLVFYMHILYTYNSVYKLFYFSCSKQENIFMHLLLPVFTILGPYSVQGLLEKAESVYYPPGNGLISRKVICAWQCCWPNISPQSCTQRAGVTPEPDSTLVM